MMWTSRTAAKAKFSQLLKAIWHWKKIVSIVSSAILLVLLFVAAIASYDMPPLEMIARSRMALSRARQAGAEIYAPKQFEATQNKWRQMMREWRLQNDRFFFNRNFKKLEKLATETHQLAVASKNKAQRTQDSLKSVVQIEISLLQQKINDFKNNYNQLPISGTSRDQFNKAELLVLESRAALNRQAYKKAATNLELAETLIGRVDKEAETKLRSYLSNLPKWRQWVQQTIAWSRDSNAVVIIVDKLAHVLQVYHNGEMIREFQVELGSNWLGHKRVRGDRATPEGQYFITKKVESGRSKYYKALAINYPNQTDLEEFEAAQQRGEISRFAQIGGLIEIHGDGGKGVNWTEGCIALRNDDMDRLFNLVKVGTPVTIVGSIKGIANNHQNSNNK
ncbi:MAG: L,D-transpeptidase family protein [candidate division KSB1 bacterium]|nr:L,D-transpeptidase family protein [candidate division KSB1 bacterium]MDZ7317843.1 L,D-transpeptidase family protein [candidate division KSB1 bacterium]MDZ7340337.1 L,D-transpeptidase family protein [candidate division KSB1 bacterium]